MKKFIALLMAAMMVFAFTACGCQDKEASADTYFEKTGTVTAVGGGNMTIETQAGEDIVFDISNAKIDADADIDVDDIATVYYSGEIEGVDATNCDVYEVYVQKGELHEMKGILKGGNPAEGTMIIECDGVQYEFNIMQAERHYSNGIAIGNEITIKYTGKIVGTDTTKANVRVVIDTDDNATKEKEDVKVKAVNETVWTTCTVNIRTGSTSASKKVATVKEGTKLTRTGILSDGWSRVTYKDSDEYIASQFLSTKDPTKKDPTKVTTTKATESTTASTSSTSETTTEPDTTTEPITTSESPVPPLNIMKGTIGEGSSMNTLELVTADGKSLFFAVTDETKIDLAGGETIGMKVVIEFEGEIVGDDASKCKLLHICDDPTN